MMVAHKIAGCTLARWVARCNTPAQKEGIFMQSDNWRKIGDLAKRIIEQRRGGK